MQISSELMETLQSGEWLSDIHISFAQDLLRKQFPDVDGLQSPLLSQNNRFFQIANEGVQIHHISSNHWVTSCSFNQEVNIYDSMFTGSINLPASC